jgi:hypothetical protein
MKPRIRIKRDITLPERLVEEVKRLIREAKAFFKAYRNLQMRCVSHIEEDRVKRWLASPELRRPT